MNQVFRIFLFRAMGLTFFLIAPCFTGCMDPLIDADSPGMDDLEASISKTLQEKKNIDADLAADSQESMEQFPVPAPPFSKGMYPCATCHATLPENFMRRELVKDHKNIKLNHGPKDRWCFDCHIQLHRDKLRLANGTTVPFAESYKLCGQCHGPKLRDWRVGVHGKRTGEWNGVKQYLLCVHCHDPHSPRFKPLAPEPPPVFL